MPMQYEYTAISEAQIPRAADPVFQHLLDTYASETNKVVASGGNLVRKTWLSSRRRNPLRS